MTEFTRNLEDLNQKHSILEESIAGRLSAEYPQLEHAFSDSLKEDLASGVGKASGNAKIIALLPLNDHPKVRSAVEEAFRGLTGKEGSKVALDLDISSPHSDLLGEENDEGLSDHFLYGISPKRILRPSSSHPQLKTISAGTFTPRAAEIYSDPGWNRLIGWTASQAEGPVVILGPPLERFTDLAALEKTEQVLIFTDPLDSDSQEQLPDLIKKLSHRFSPQSSLRFIWLGEEEEPEKGEEEISAQEENQPAEKPSEAEEVTAAATEEIAEQLPAEQEELPGPDEAGIERAEAPESEPGEEKEEKAAAALEEEQAQKAEVDEEEEIFLPEELLFLDDDEKQLTKTADDSSVSDEIGGYLDINKLPGLTDIDKAKKVAAESPAGADTGIEKAEPESVEATPETISMNAEGIRIEGELGGLSQQEPETEETGPEEEAETTAVESRAETEGEEAEALYTQADPEDELELEEEAAVEEVETGTGEDQSALEQMKSFEEALEAPSPEEVELKLDSDPLGDAAAAAESGEEPAESTELVEETAASDEAGSEEKAGEEAEEEIPAQEAVEQAGEEAPKEEAVEEAAEKESEEGLKELGEEELETLDEAELEPMEEEGAAEKPVEEEAGLEPAEAEKGPSEEEAKEEIPVEEAATEEVAGEKEAEPEAVQEPEEAGEEKGEPAEGEAEPEAVQKPEEAGEEKGEPAEGEAEPEAVQKPEEAGEEPAGEKEPAGEEAEPVLEEVAEEGAGEAEAPSEEKEEGVKAPADEDIDELLSGAAALEDIDEGITLEELGEPEAAEVAPGARKPKKRSKVSSLATVTFLLILAAGMFIVWKQGTVSSFVRRLPGIIGVQSLIPGLGGKDEEELALAEKARTDSIRLAQEREAMLAAAERYDKLAYSIQIGSYRFLPRALAARDLLRENGLNDVYVVPLTLDSLGNWNRLYMGMFESAEKADTALLGVDRTLRTTAANFKMQGGAIRRHTPLTLKIGETSSADSLENLIQRLEDSNIPTYMVKLSADTTQAPIYRLYVGAFETVQQAVYMRTKIFNLGVQAEIIPREGTVEKKEG